MVSEALDALQAENLLSDQRFTEQFVTQRAERGKGPVRIRHELRERGVGRELADRSLEDDELDWCRRAWQARCKRFGAAPPEEYAERMRQARFLEYRGFDGEQIRYALGAGDDGHEDQ